MSGFGAADIQALINAGMGYASAVLGTSTTVYRPSSASAPIVSGNLIGTLLASFNTSAKFDAVKPSDYPNPKFYGLFDRTTTLSGDYLVNGVDTYFIASQDLNQSTMCVQCNRTVSFTRPTGDSEPSTALDTYDYGGRSDQSDVTVATGWPASVLIKTRGEASQVDLPGDPKQALFEVLLPAIPGVTLRTSDLMRDDLGQRYALSAVELTSLGLRIYAQLNVT